MTRWLNWVASIEVLEMTFNIYNPCKWLSPRAENRSLNLELDTYQLSFSSWTPVTQNWSRDNRTWGVCTKLISGIYLPPLISYWKNDSWICGLFGACFMSIKRLLGWYWVNRWSGVFSHFKPATQMRTGLGWRLRILVKSGPKWEFLQFQYHRYHCLSPFCVWIHERVSREF